MQSLHPYKINAVVDIQVVITSSANGILEVTFAATLNLVYDANGNLVTGDGKYRVYNGFNQLSAIYNGSDSNGRLLEEYEYHPTEERIYLKRIYEAGALKDTISYPTKTFVRIENSSGTYDFTYIRHEGQLVAQLNPDGGKYFIHDDHLGSTSTVTNSTGSVVESTTYTPYGEILSGGTVSRFDYTGKEYSTVVGDYDYNFRKMKPEWAIFTQPDSLLPNVYDPQQLNRYSYARNNPYTYKDENGHEAISFIVVVGLALLIGYLLGAGTEAATQRDTIATGHQSEANQAQIEEAGITEGVSTAIGETVAAAGKVATGNILAFLVGIPSVGEGSSCDDKATACSTTALKQKETQLPQVAYGYLGTSKTEKSVETSTTSGRGRAGGGGSICSATACVPKPETIKTPIKKR